MKIFKKINLKFLLLIVVFLSFGHINNSEAETYVVTTGYTGNIHSNRNFTFTIDYDRVVFLGDRVNFTVKIVNGQCQNGVNWTANNDWINSTPMTFKESATNKQLSGGNVSGGDYKFYSTKMSIPGHYDIISDNYYLKKTQALDGNYDDKISITDTKIRFPFEVKTKCIPGQYYETINDFCYFCPAGTYSSAGGGVGLGSCTTCPAGTYSSAGASSCTKCPKGTYQDGTGRQQCEDAGVDKYVDTEGATQPINCPSGKTTNGNTKATDVSQCVNSCSAGQYYDTSNNSCQSCPSGQTSPANSVGESSCRYDYATMCPDIGSEWIRTDLNIGAYPFTTSTKDGEWTSPFNVYGNVYLRGAQPSSESSTLGIQRTINNRSTWGIAFSTGVWNSFYDTGTSILARNPAGLIVYKSTCDITCPAGSIGLNGKAPCSKCQRGTFQDWRGQQQCKDPGVDKYVDTEGATQPINCPSGKTTNGNTRATDVSQCVPTTPTSCQPGSAPIDGVCTQCPAGKYSANGSDCIQCAPNTTSLSGATTCFSKDSCPVDTSINTQVQVVNWGEAARNGSTATTQNTLSTVVDGISAGYNTLLNSLIGFTNIFRKD